MNDEAARKTAERGRRFREWCEGPDGLYAVFAAVEKNYAETLFSSDITDAALRERVCHRIAALRDLKLVMSTAITEGKGAEAMILQAAKLEEKKRARKAPAKA
jgi:hypothetical protein